jgi:phosphoribosylaminoimidazolecarboxamide formyltransferase/IMP cyclohydrolase
VAIVTDPNDYQNIADALAKNKGALPYALRQSLAQKAFARTAAYDAAISNWFANALDIANPPYRTIGGKLAEVMRYGENPHQKAAFYKTGETRKGVATATQLQGKKLSYNNINDTDAAFEMASEFDPDKVAAVVIVKHANPCGVAIGKTLKEAYLKALACDPVSAFGGIVAMNRPLDAATSTEIVKIMTEVIIAPEVEAEANAMIASRKNLPYASMIHAKDFHLKDSTYNPGEGWAQTPGGNYRRGAIVGNGDIKANQIIKFIKASGYDGFLSVEFEGMEDCFVGSRIGMENVKIFWNE